MNTFRFANSNYFNNFNSGSIDSIRVFHPFYFAAISLWLKMSISIFPNQNFCENLAKFSFFLTKFSAQKLYFFLNQKFRLFGPKFIVLSRSKISIFTEIFRFFCQIFGFNKKFVPICFTEISIFS